MSKRITSGKRDREKLKQQKKQEKLKKKEERQSSGSRSFEDMIAYVDENGMLHSEPPEIKQREAIDASQIAISVPKQEDQGEALPLNGRVEHYNSSKGYGFIKDLGSSEKYFFHVSSAPEEIMEGDIVTFELERGKRGMNAIEIQINNKPKK